MKVRVCVCVMLSIHLCVQVHICTYTYIDTHTHAYITFICTRRCVCMCVYACIGAKFINFYRVKPCIHTQIHTQRHIHTHKLTDVEEKSNTSTGSSRKYIHRYTHKHTYIRKDSQMWRRNRTIRQGQDRSRASRDIQTYINTHTNTYTYTHKLTEVEEKSNTFTGSRPLHSLTRPSFPPETKPSGYVEIAKIGPLCAY